MPITLFKKVLAKTPTEIMYGGSITNTLQKKYLSKNSARACILLPNHSPSKCYEKWNCRTMVSGEWKTLED